MMKSVFLAIVVTAAIFALFYLIGCFVQNSFNIGDWSQFARVLVGLFGGLISIIMGMIASGMVEDE